MPLTACSSSADGDPGHVDDAAHGDTTATEAADDHAGADADGDGHSDTDAHTDGDGDDAEANAYLEAAPKDSLFLVDMSQLLFTPGVLEVKAGEVVEIAIQNTEATLHDFTIDKIDADVHISYLGGTGHDRPPAPRSRRSALFIPSGRPLQVVVGPKLIEVRVNGEEHDVHCWRLGSGSLMRALDRFDALPSSNFRR